MTVRLSGVLGACALAAAVSLSVAGVAATSSGPIVREASAPSTRQVPQRRYIVRYRSGTLQRASTTQALTTARAVLVNSGLAASGITVRHVRRLASGADVIAFSRPLDAVQGAQVMRAFAADASVASIVPDRRMFHTGVVGPTAMPNDPLSSGYQWHLYNSIGGIYAPAAWDKSTGAGVVVAVLDTGITDHPDLAPNLLQGYDFISDPFVSRRADESRVPGAHDYGDWNDDWMQCEVHASSFHGTHTAGTVAEATNNGIGLAGVAHGAKVLPVRVLGRCGGYTSDIADAITWSSGGVVPGVPNNTTPAEVINMSLGGEFACDEVLQGAIDGAVARGTTVVVSAGNWNADSAQFAPASCNNVINVGASRIGGGKAFYSNWGKVVDLSAPGGGGGQDVYPNGYVWQTLNDSLTSPEEGSPVYGGMAGTSMSAPHVAGVVALVQSIATKPLTPAQMETMLKATARPFPVAMNPAMPMGAGLLNAKAALATVLPPCTGADCESNAIALVNKLPVKNLSGAINSQRSYKFDAKTGLTSLSFMTYGGTGNVSVYVRYGQVPTTSAYDQAAIHLGNNETVRITVPRAGTYYVKVVGAAAYAGVTLEARAN
ncbi:S8 family serine peptidase [Lysobacter sp. A6]|uniref:S8 family serine peptidase n=1 Tax=Noviluteimonas lactosilytica TaxID=2888523 RepID=A0ABS8JH46_9GAMM|nr:S8 family peptidase [Lysobacter lactosilyticus]MCC8362875.1 S8 family serine peptidase [Lysobacter lactosilyticus]